MILLTGGTGLLGTHTLLALARNKTKVLALKRSTSKTNVLGRLAQKDEIDLQYITWIDADLRDVTAIYDLTKNIDTVIHCGAFVSFVASEQNFMHQTNTDGTSYLINACLANNVKRFIHVSSIATLGNSLTGLVSENNHWIPSDYHSNYAISKYGAEREVWRGMAEGLKAVIINPSIILGEGFWDKNGGALIKYASRNNWFYPKGSTGFVDVTDVVNTILFLLDHDINGQRFIINGHNTSYKNILYQAAQLMGKRPPPIKASAIATHVAWQLQKLLSLITGSQPLLTRETAISSMAQKAYSNTLMLKHLSVPITPLEQTLARICKCYEADNTF